MGTVQFLRRKGHHRANRRCRRENGTAPSCSPMTPTAPTRTFTVALIGNPNTGKSTLFTGLVGVRQHVGNYPGVTVEKKTGQMEFAGRQFEFVDLPGLYSLAPRSRDEMVAVDLLLGRRDDLPRGGCRGVHRRCRQPAAQLVPCEPGARAGIAHRAGRQHARRGQGPRDCVGFASPGASIGHPRAADPGQPADRTFAVERSTRPSLSPAPFSPAPFSPGMFSPGMFSPGIHAGPLRSARRKLPFPPRLKPKLPCWNRSCRMSTPILRRATCCGDCCWT